MLSLRRFLDDQIDFAAAVVMALMRSAPAMAQELPDGTTQGTRGFTETNAEQLAWPMPRAIGRAFHNMSSKGCDY